MSDNSGNSVPLFHSLLVHTNLIGKKIVDNNSNDDDAEYYVVSRLFHVQMTKSVNCGQHVLTQS